MSDAEPLDAANREAESALVERAYRSLYRIRRAEEEISRIYPSDKIKSPVHLSIGQEGVSVGVCEALRADDVVFGTYRGHAMYLAKGGDLSAMMAELYGKDTGCGRGKAGSMHLVSVPDGVMGTSAVVGTTIPNAVGYALGVKMRKEARVVVSFFGDGAAEEGAFWESLNFAALKQVPLIFVCENNRYAIHSHQDTRQPADNLCERVASFGIPAQRIEANDCWETYRQVKVAADALRSGEQTGPLFFECMTYRWVMHVGPGADFDLGYRNEAEAKPWIDGDPVKVVGEQLAAIDGERKSAVEAEVEAELRAAVQFAEDAPWPAPEELWTDVYAD